MLHPGNHFTAHMISTRAFPIVQHHSCSCVQSKENIVKLNSSTLQIICAPPLLHVQFLSLSVLGLKSGTSEEATGVSGLQGFVHRPTVLVAAKSTRHSHLTFLVLFGLHCTLQAGVLVVRDCVTYSQWACCEKNGTLPCLI